MQRKAWKSSLKLCNAIQTEVTHKTNSASLVVGHRDEMDFVYRVKLRKQLNPEFTDPPQSNHYHYRAEVYLNEGGQQYDVMGYSKQQLINDILDQYEKHRHFLDIIR